MQSNAFASVSNNPEHFCCTYLCCIFKEIAIFGVVAKDTALLLRWILLVEHPQSHLTKDFWLSLNSLLVLHKFSQNNMKCHF